MEDRTPYREYVDRMARIRVLSSPQLLDTDDAEGYTERLRESFKTIGELAGFNRSLLDSELYPLLESDGTLSDPEARDLSELGNGLLNLGGIEEFESLDVPMMSLISSRLMSSAYADDNLPAIIRQLDTEIVACYSLMNMTERISSNQQICEEFRRKGLKTGEFFLTLLEKDQFVEVEDVELRGLILTNARFSVAFYEHLCNDNKANTQNLAILDHMLAIADDPFYIDAVPGFDWKYFRFRTMEYALQSIEAHNCRGFNDEQLNHIADLADQMESLCATDPAYFSGLIGYPSMPIICARSRYLTGRIGAQEYEKVLLEHYEHRDISDFGSDGCDANILVPLEFMCLIAQRDPSAWDVALLNKLYRNLSAYIFRMPNVGSLSFVLEYYAEVIERFVDIPSGMSFEAFSLQLMAGLHPPTYVHSRMVARISECLCAHVVRHKPELMVGIYGCKTVEEVKRRRDELVAFTYHSALCHDFGKLAIIDTIFMYGRRLLDLEFDIIKAHPDMGAQLLEQHYTTCSYADIARGHHRWYDDSRGYPEDFVTADSPLKTLIDLVACADCMDAATDSIGRSYKSGKGLDEFIDELREGAGTRYAPWLVELFEEPDVYADMEYLLTEGRRETYRDTYNLLRNVSTQGEGSGHIQTDVDA